MPVTHLFVNPKPDGADTTVTRPSDWNAAHVISVVNADVDPAAAIAESKLALNFATHAAVTLGTANGLSLVGQALSLGLASGAAAGALSAADWTTFNGKQSALTFPLSPANGGTGVNNGTNALTVPATGTAALLATANIFTVLNTFKSAVGIRLEGTGANTNIIDLIPGIASSITRLDFFSGNTNKGVQFQLFPNGTATRTKLAMGNQSSQSNFGSVFLEIDGATSYLSPQNAGSPTTPVTTLRLGTGTNITTEWTYIISNPSRFGIGLTTTPQNKLHVVLDDEFQLSRPVLRLEATINGGAGANGLGAGHSMWAETATVGTSQQQGFIGCSWIDATNATRKAKMSLSAYDTAQRVGLEIEASGTAAKLGFFGGTTAVQQTLNAYTSDGEGAAYTGIDNLQAGTVYATVADLNQLRVAYETLRASYDDLRTKLQTSTLVA